MSSRCDWKQGRISSVDVRLVRSVSRLSLGMTIFRFSHSFFSGESADPAKRLSRGVIRWLNWVPDSCTPVHSGCFSTRFEPH